MRLALRPFLQTALTRGRELKLLSRIFDLQSRMTALTRGRELKSNCIVHREGSGIDRPHARARIEIHNIPFRLFCRKTALTRGRELKYVRVSPFHSIHLTALP